jgi:flagellar protein FlgJ
MLPNDFISAVAPAAQQCMRQSKVFASVTLAQAILESGWGSSGLAQKGFNLFGIKAIGGWTGPTISMPTREVVNGQSITVQAAFRKYPNWLGSIQDHAAFLTGNPRYAAAFKAANGEAFATAIAAAGYATDPNYANSLIALMRQHNLAQYDQA